MRVYNPSTTGAEAGGLQVRAQPELLGNLVGLSLKKAGARCKLSARSWVQSLILHTQLDGPKSSTFSACKTPRSLTPLAGDKRTSKAKPGDTGDRGSPRLVYWALGVRGEGQARPRAASPKPPPPPTRPT